MRVSLSEEGGEGSWVRAADHHDGSIGFVLVAELNEVGKVSKPLLGTEVFEVFGLQGGEGLRLSVEPVLDSNEQCLVLRSDHEGVESVLSDGAGVLAADVKEHWAVFLVEVLVVLEVALIVKPAVQEIKVVDGGFDPTLAEVSRVDLWEISKDVLGFVIDVVLFIPCSNSRNESSGDESKLHYL